MLSWQISFEMTFIILSVQTGHELVINIIIGECLLQLSGQALELGVCRLPIRKSSSHSSFVLPDCSRPPSYASVKMLLLPVGWLRFWALCMPPPRKREPNNWCTFTGSYVLLSSAPSLHKLLKSLSQSHYFWQSCSWISPSIGHYHTGRPCSRLLWQSYRQLILCICRQTLLCLRCTVWHFPSYSHGMCNLLVCRLPCLVRP